MESLHLIFDTNKCVGCFNCLMACKDEHVGNKWLPYTDEQAKHGENWIRTVRKERGTVPFTEVHYETTLCQHCDDAPCKKAFPDAVTKREDGIVLLDPEKAKGNRDLVKACPYGAITWNEELETAQKCTLCAHLLDQGWKEPRCVQACPLRALSLVRCSDEEFEAMKKEQRLKPITDGRNKPRLLYRNLHKLNTNFIAGDLCYRDGARETAAAGAKVELWFNGELLADTATDFFGGYKLDMIPADTGTFTLRFTLDGFRPAEKNVTVGRDSVCLDAVCLERA